jgi:hypothetical protein
MLMTTLIAQRHSIECYISAEDDKPIPRVVPTSSTASRRGSSVDQRACLALEVRKCWMRQMGLTEEEIQEFCQLDEEPLRFEEELANLFALRDVKNLTPSYAELKRLVDRVAPSEVSRRAHRHNSD